MTATESQSEDEEARVSARPRSTPLLCVTPLLRVTAARLAVSSVAGFARDCSHPAREPTSKYSKKHQYHQPRFREQRQDRANGRGGLAGKTGWTKWRNSKGKRCIKSPWRRDRRRNHNFILQISVCTQAPPRATGKPGPFGTSSQPQRLSCTRKKHAHRIWPAVSRHGRHP